MVKREQEWGRREQEMGQEPVLRLDTHTRPDGTSVPRDRREAPVLHTLHRYLRYRSRKIGEERSNSRLHLYHRFPKDYMSRQVVRNLPEWCIRLSRRDHR